MHKVSGAVVAETEYGVSDAARGLTKLDLRELELKDMEVARKIQEEELKVRGLSDESPPLDRQDFTSTHCDSFHSLS